ncbi:Scr1 family TA system antitoxin-like transcriptional regulator [Streptomyces sp. NPDC004728]|uniref:Scr1 family TA system antitoxin-like transcriptional regulator n=1 Tax=Streptomyces sp. NPDC004728 TaxID=3154289 RepID=UPI0033B49609
MRRHPLPSGRTCRTPTQVSRSQLDNLTLEEGAVTVPRELLANFGPKEPAHVPQFITIWLYDDRLAIVEDWHAELWIDDPESTGVYRRVWDSLTASAVYGTGAHRLIARARAQLNLS